MNIAIAAAPAEFSEFTWYKNAGPEFVFKPGNSQHALNVQKGDLIGLKKTARGPTAGQYQVVLEKYPHIIFRSVRKEAVEEHLSKFKPYDGIPAKPEKTGQRHARVKVKGADAHDKQTALKYKPEKLPKEEGQYDKANYQWREVVHGPIPIATMHHKKTRTALKKGDIIGVRFWTPARGGFIIMPSGERVNISETTYESVTSGATILPSARQQVGIVVLTDIAHQLPKRSRITKVKPEKPLEFEDDDEFEDDEEHETAKQVKRGKNFLQQHKDIVSDFEYEDDDDEDDFEDDDDDFDEFEEDDDSEEETEESEDDDSEDSVNTEDDDTQFVEEGMIIQLANGKKLTVAAIEELEVSDLLYLYDTDTGNFRKQPIPSGLDVRKLPGGAKLVGRAKEDELQNIRRRVARLLHR
jgi:hypothetical protein